jgi:ankyrin repeat-rich membrane spanning protein
MPFFFVSQVTLEEQMICGALQTLNEDAFEDCALSERPSPTGELIQQYSLAPISEELGSPTHSRNCENFLDDAPNQLTPNNNRYDDSNPSSTVIYIPNYTPSVDDTCL